METASQRGGKRPGAGRPKGSLNKTTVARDKAIADSGLTPLGYMIDMLRDEDRTQEERQWAAKSAAPYMHPRLEAVAFQDQTNRPSHEQALGELDALAFKAEGPKIINHDPQKETPGVTGRTEDQGTAA